MVVFVHLNSREKRSIGGTSPYVLIVDDVPDGREMLDEYPGFAGSTS